MGASADVEGASGFTTRTTGDEGAGAGTGAGAGGVSATLADGFFSKAKYPIAATASSTNTAATILGVKDDPLAGAPPVWMPGSVGAGMTGKTETLTGGGGGLLIEYPVSTIAVSTGADAATEFTATSSASVCQRPLSRRA